MPRIPVRLHLARPWVSQCHRTVLRDCKRRFQRLNLMRPKIVTTYRINPQIWVKHWMENTQRESSRIFRNIILHKECPLGSVEDDRPNTCSCTEEISRWANIPTYGPASGTRELSVLDTCRLQREKLKGHSYSSSRWLIFGLGAWIYNNASTFLMSNLC